jgi:hypothetical protein
MLQIARLNFAIVHRDGRSEELSVDSDRALVGSGAYCEVRLPADEAASEVMLIEERNGSLFAEIRCFDPAPRMNGIEFTGGRIHDDAVLQIGNCQLKVKQSQAEFQGGQRKLEANKSFISSYGPLLLILAGGAMIFMQQTPSDNDAVVPPVPALFGETTTEKCPQQSSAPAEALALQHLQAAEGRRERAPFHVQDGVVATSFFEKAAACFARSGNSPGEQDARHSADVLRRQLKEDLHIHQVRFERSLSTKDYAAARREAQILQEFFQGRKEDYVTWLSSTDRALELKFSGGPAK